MSTVTQALNRSMSQLGHDPHGYNPVNYQHQYHWAQSLICMFQRGPAMNINSDTSS